MIRWLKIIFFVILFTPLILFLAFWGAVYFIDFNQYKPQLEAEVYEKTGHKFELLGDLNFQVVPLRLELGNSKLYQKEEFNSNQSLLEFEQLNLNLSLVKLIFEKQLHLLGIEVLEPKLHLQVNELGHTNWNNLAAQNTEYQFVKVSQQAADTNLKALGFLQSFELKSLNIENGEVTYENKLNQELYQLRNWNLMAFNLAFEQNFRVQSTAKVEDIKRQETTKLELKGEGFIGQDFNSVELRKVLGSIDKTLSQDEDQEGKIDFTLEKAIWDKSTNNLTLDQLNFQVKGDDLSISLTSDLDEFSGQGKLEIARVNPTKWLDYFLEDNIQWLKSRSMKRLRGTTDFSFNLQGYSLENIQLRLDSTNIEGSFNHQFEPPKYTFNLVLDEINLDNYKIIAKAEDGTTQEYLPLAVPVNTIRNTSIDGTLDVKKLTAWQGNYTNLFTQISSNFGQMRLAPFDLELYSGKWQSSLLIDTNGDTPTYTAKGKLSQVQTQDWLKDLFNYSDLEGKLNLQFNFQTHGTNLELIKTNLKGDYNLEVLEGAYLALNLDKLVVGQISEEHDKTLFKLAQINGQANNGKLHIQQGLIQSQRLSAKTFGAVNLLENTLDNQVSVNYTNPPSVLAFLAKVDIPIKLTGSLNNPQWQLDFNKMSLSN